MVISSVIGSSFQHILTSSLPPPPSSSSSPTFPVPLSSTKLRAVRNSEFTTSVTTLTTATSTLDGGAHRGELTKSSSNNLASVFRRATQSAILEIQESSDLESSLSRLLIIIF